MAAHQRRFHGEADAESNRLLAVDAIERLEHELADAKPQAAPAPPVIEPKTTREHKDVDGRGYVVKKEQGSDSTLVRRASPHEAWFLAHALPRIELLLTKGDAGPLGGASWRDRVLAAMSIQAHAASLRAAAEDPAVFEKQKRDVEKMSAIDRDQLFKTLGISGISDLTPGFARQKADELDRKYLGALCEVLEDSGSVFGDWKKDTPTKPTVS